MSVDGTPPGPDWGAMPPSGPPVGPPTQHPQMPQPPYQAPQYPSPLPPHQFGQPQYPSPPYPAPHPQWGQPVHPPPAAPPQLPGPPPVWGPVPVAPPRRSRAGQLVAAVVGTAVVCGLLAMVAVVTLAGRLSSNATDTASAPATPSAAPTTASSATPTPSVSRAATDSTANRPTPWDDPQWWTKKNPLYAQTLARKACTKAVPVVPGDSKAVMRAKLKVTLGCMVKAWAPTADVTELEIHTPALTVYFDKGHPTPCGRAIDRAAAFYCPRDENMYVKGFGIASTVRTPWALERVVAHELGHSVQHDVGISDAEWTQRKKAKGDARMESSRRNELQAECFAGLIMNSTLSLTAENRRLLGLDSFYRGDDQQPGKAPRDHGKGVNTQKWFLRGAGATKVSVCNTFVAKAAEVS